MSEKLKCICGEEFYDPDCFVSHYRECKPGEKTLDKPGKVGNAVFGKGVSERLLIESAQRQYAHDWEEKQKKGLVCQHGKIKSACIDCGAIAF